jgi:hypothetical protein
MGLKCVLYFKGAVILEDYDRYHRDAADLGDAGIPLVAVERTPYQQLWIRWVNDDNFLLIASLGVY